MKFTEFGLDSSLLEGVDALGFEMATPVQDKAIPPILMGKDIIASAQTGTGKTAAFLLPIIHQIISHPHEEYVQALIVVPTRELAMQIDQQLEGLAYFTSIGSRAVYGGTDGISYEAEKQAFVSGADIIIGTPGRLISHLNMKWVNFSHLKYLILDEADRMLDMGFYEDIMKIISFLPKKRQNLLFAATMPQNIRKLAKTVLNDPVEINIAISKPVEKIMQVAYVIYEAQKGPLLIHLLKGRNLQSVLVFCSTKSNTKTLAKELKRSGLAVEEIHSDLDQKKREEVLRKFKNRELNILVATDILSRGIDVDNIDLVINYDVPNDGEDYIHRIGRTARAETEGIAITLINEKEQSRFAEIEELLEKPVLKVRSPEDLGKTPEYKPKKYRRKRY